MVPMGDAYVYAAMMAVTTSSSIRLKARRVGRMVATSRWIKIVRAGPMA
jgi:hypothetical protein